MKKIIIIILAFLCIDSFCQQNEIIKCPKSAMDIQDPVVQHFLNQLETEFPGYIDLGSEVLSKIYNPPQPLNFRLNNDYLLFAHSIGCVTSGVIYYVKIKPEALNYHVPDGVTTGNPLFKDWLINELQVNDSTVLGNIPWEPINRFLSHSEAVILANYFMLTGNGKLINIKEWNELKPIEEEEIW